MLVMTQLHELVSDLAAARNDTSITALDDSSVRSRIWVHDLPEIITGDKCKKSRRFRRREKQAETEVAQTLLALGQFKYSRSVEEYSAKSSLEDRYVKVLDELQALAFLLWIKRANWSKFGLRPDKITGFAFLNEFLTLALVAEELLRRLKKLQT